MIKNLIRGFVTIVGALLGYGTSTLAIYLLEEFGVSQIRDMSPLFRFSIPVISAIIFGLLFFIIAPAITRQSRRIADNIGRDLANVSAGTIVFATIGLLLGLMIATLLAQLFRVIPNSTIYAVVVVITYAILCYLGVTMATVKGKDLFDSIVSSIKQGDQARSVSMGRKKRTDSPKIFDTSVIIDGRISEIMKTGFLEGQIVIPDFVLVELRHIADSADSLKRTRGRRGLDILNKIREDYGVEIYNTDNDKELKEIPEVDVKLLKLAQLIGGDVVTNDFNLNKVAGINGVRVLNINELANCLKPVVIPGEDMTVALVKQGKDPSQAIGYLDDGTMIVCEDGKDEIGNTVTIKVTSVLQTSAGRMIFGRLKKDEHA